MKIALIIPALAKGGAERTISNLSLMMQKEHDVHVIVLDSSEKSYPHGGILIDLKTPPSKKGVLGKGFTLLKRAYRLNKLFKQEKYDAIYALMEAAGAPAVLASKRTIVSVRDTPESLAAFHQKMIKLVYPRAQKVVAVAKATENKLRDSYGLKNTTTIYNMANLDMAKTMSAAPIDIDYPFILAVGRLAKQKGFDLLIEAFAASKASQHIKLLILGDGQEQQALEQLAVDKKVETQVVFYGNTDNPFAFYSKADFFTLSSRHEGFPNILVEALATGCACLSVDCPTGPNEIIVDGNNGMLIEADNIPKLTKAMDQLYFDEALKTKFRAQAKASVSYLKPQAIAQQWIDLIHHSPEECIPNAIDTGI